MIIFAVLTPPQIGSYASKLTLSVRNDLLGGAEIGNTRDEFLGGVFFVVLGQCACTGGE